MNQFMFAATRKKVSVLICSFIIFTFLGNASGDELFSKMQVIKPKTRMEAPPFELTSVDGSVKKLDDFKGKVILLNFWATWCGPRRDEMPALERLAKAFKDKDFTIVAIAADRGKKAMHTVKEHCKMHNVTFTVLLDPDGKVRKKYEVSALPTSYIIGGDGKLSGKILGARKWDSDDSFTFFESFLN